MLFFLYCFRSASASFFLHNSLLLSFPYSLCSVVCEGRSRERRREGRSLQAGQVENAGRVVGVRVGEGGRGGASGLLRLWLPEKMKGVRQEGAKRLESPRAKMPC